MNRPTSPIGKASIANDKCSESENSPKVPPPIPLIGMNEPTSQDIAIAEPTKGKATRASFVSKLDAAGRDRESIGKIITGRLSTNCPQGRAGNAILIYIEDWIRDYVSLGRELPESMKQALGPQPPEQPQLGNSGRAIPGRNRPYSRDAALALADLAGLHLRGVAMLGGEGLGLIGAVAGLTFSGRSAAAGVSRG
jgi:hypothetical protein